MSTTSTSISTAMHNIKNSRRFLMLAALLLVLTIAAPRQAAEAKRVNMSMSARTAREVFLEVNKRRGAAGKPELEIDATLNNIAASHSNNLATHKVTFGHAGFDGRLKMIKKEWGPARSFAENVGKDYTAEAAMKAWWASPGHKKNILGDYTHTGISVVRGDDGYWYFTQIFVKK